MSLHALLHDVAVSVSVSFSAAQGEVILRGVAEALRFLHLRLIIRRDIEPSNVLLARAGGAAFKFAGRC